MFKIRIIASICTMLIFSVQAIPEPTVVNLSNKVIKQEGNTCGFHAIKNAYWTNEWMRKKISQQALEEKLSSEPDTNDFPLAVCQVEIGQLDDLSEEQIRTIARTMQMPADQLSVIGNITEFNPAAMGQGEFNNLVKALASIQQGKPAIHAFALGTMRHVQQEQGSISSTYGHWIAAVVQSVDPKTLNIYYLDSLGNSINDEIIQGLTKLLKTPVNILQLKRRYENVIDSAEATATLGRVQSSLGHLNKIPKETPIEDLVLAFGRNKIQRILYTLLRVSLPNSDERKAVTRQLAAWFAYAYEQQWLKSPSKENNQDVLSKAHVVDAQRPARLPLGAPAGTTLEQAYPFDLENKSSEPIWVKVANSGRLVTFITKVDSGQSFRIGSTSFTNNNDGQSFKKPTLLWIYKEQPSSNEQSVKPFASYYLDESTKQQFIQGKTGSPEYQTIYLKWENGELLPRVGSFFRKRTPSGLSVVNNIPASYIHKGEV